MDVGILPLVHTNVQNSGSYSNVVGWSSSLLDVGHTWGESSGKKADAITPGDREIPPRGPQVSGPRDYFETGAWWANEFRWRL